MIGGSYDYSLTARSIFMKSCQQSLSLLFIYFCRTVNLKQSNNPLNYFKTAIHAKNSLRAEIGMCVLPQNGKVWGLTSQ